MIESLDDSLCHNLIQHGEVRMPYLLMNPLLTVTSTT